MSFPVAWPQPGQSWASWQQSQHAFLMAMETWAALLLGRSLAKPGGGGTLGSGDAHGELVGLGTMAAGPWVCSAALPAL